MRKAGRWNNGPSKRSLLDSCLDKVIGDLFPGSDRPKCRRSGAIRPTKTPPRQSFALEALEPRLLLPADEVTFGDGTANSKIDLDVDVNVRLTNSEVSAHGKITLSELQGTEPTNLVTQNATGSLGVSRPTSATLGSFTFGNALLMLTDTNLFDLQDVARRHVLLHRANNTPTA